MNIVMVGARAFPIIKAGVAICELLARMPEPHGAITIHTRAGDSGPDAFIAEAAGIMGFKIERWKGEGGASNYIRDVDMTKQADAVYAFFEADHVGEGGTQHVVEKSLDQHKRTHSYTWDGYKLVLVGSDDGVGDIGPTEDNAAGEAEAVGQASPKRTRGSGPRTESRTGPVWPGASGEDDVGAHPQD